MKNDNKEIRSSAHSKYRCHYTANFVITILNQEKYRYPVFGRAFTKDLIKQTKVYLPIDKDGNPDYQFMEDYIKSIPFSKKI